MKKQIFGLHYALSLLMLVTVAETRPLLKVTFNGKPVYGIRKLGALTLGSAITSLIGTILAMPLLMAYGLFKGASYLNTNRKLNDVLKLTGQYHDNDSAPIKAMPLKDKQALLDCLRKSNKITQSTVNKCKDLHGQNNK